MKMRLFFLVTLLSAVTTLQASTMLSTVGGEFPGLSFLVNNSLDQTENMDDLAIGFRTGGEGSYQLNFVTLRFLDADPGTNGTISLALYMNAGDQVPPTAGSLLGSFTGEASPLSEGTYQYDAIGDIVLASETSYWLVVQANGVNAGSYRPGASFAAENNSTGWSVPDYPNSVAYHDVDDGLSTYTWVFDEIGGGGSAIVTFDAAVVPEPSTWALLSVSALGLALVVRRNGRPALRS
jgi:hypothetical protein